MKRPTTLAARARDSAWISEEAGLASSVGSWEAAVGETRQSLSALAAAMARPGRVPADRAVRHVTAAGISRLIRIGTNLPGDLLDLKPLRDPEAWARRTSVEAFADQLALGGPATAELARVIVNAGQMFPAEIVEELRARPIDPLVLDPARVEEIGERSIGGITQISADPIAALPISQLHAAELADGRTVALRVRRPGVTRELLADARLSASLAAPLQQILPSVGGLHPLGVVQLTTRLSIEAIDLRFEMLGAVELGLLAEELGTEHLTVARPIAGHAAERAALSESFEGTLLTRLDRSDQLDGAAVVADLARITIESALTHGVFWADPAPDNLLARPDGRVVLVGAGAVGRLDPTLRHAGIEFLRSLLSGDAGGAVGAMGRADAIPPDADVDQLVTDFESAEMLQVSTILAGGEQGLLGALNEAVRLLLRHQVRPPLDVVVLLRAIFALGALSNRLVPEGGGLMPAMFPLIQRLPDLIAEAEQGLGDPPDPAASGPR